MATKNSSLIIGYAFVAGIIALVIRVFFIDFEGEMQFNELDLATKIITVWGVISGISLWFWMLADFFQNGVPKMKKTWGFLLVIGVYAVATVYFLVIYAPRKNKELRAAH